MLLAELGPEARLLAGGHSLLPMMKLRLAAPSHVIDIDPLADELGYVEAHGDEVRIGALARHRALLESGAAGGAARDLHRRGAGDRRPRRPQPRDDRRRALPGRPVRGPVGRLRRGRRVDGDPRAPAAPSASSGMRDFHRRPYETAVGPAEMLVEIRVPLRARRGQRLREARPPRRRLGRGGGRRGAGDRRRRDRPRGRRARGGRRGDHVGRGRGGARGRAPGRTSPSPAPAALAARACSPVTDQRGSAEFKRHVVGVLVERALRRASARAVHEQEVLA